jgi:hypothetical protein
MLQSGVSVMERGALPIPRVSGVASSFRAVTRGSNPCPDNHIRYNRTRPRGKVSPDIGNMSPKISPVPRRAVGKVHTVGAAALEVVEGLLQQNGASIPGTRRTLGDDKRHIDAVAQQRHTARADVG